MASLIAVLNKLYHHEICISNALISEVLAELSLHNFESHSKEQTSVAISDSNDRREKSRDDNAMAWLLDF